MKSTITFVLFCLYSVGVVLAASGTAEAIFIGDPSVTLATATGKGNVTLTTNQSENCYFVGVAPAVVP